MNKFSKGILAMMLMIVTSISVFAQENETNKTDRTKFSIEIDPATFVFSGFAIHLRVQPKNSQHLLVGAGAYAMNFPDILVDLNKENKGAGWDVRLNQGYGLFGEYHFSEVNKKWYVGVQLAGQEYKIQKDLYDGEAKYSTMLLMGLGGYTLQPFDFPLYFKFWGGVGYTGKISGENLIGNAEYNISPILIFGALHVGYTF
ncbi:MAG TPA: hypothetical protein ENJ53_01840 [Phaeodactylibacter sp.]|nr:hypothetical protein [Phaeodactylibacter sp.]